MQSRTRPWSSGNHPTLGHKGLSGSPRREPAAAREASAKADELGRARRTMDPTTRQALDSLQSLHTSPPPAPATRSGVAPRGRARASTPPPAPPARPRVNTPSWSPQVQTQAAGLPAEEPTQLPTPEEVAAPALAQPVTPVARPVLATPVTPIAVAASQRSNPWWGWAVAAGLAAFGIVFHLLTYAPLQSDLTRLEQTNATLRQEHEATLSKLRAELAAAQSRAEAATSEPTATAPAQVPVAVAVVPRKREPNAAEAKSIAAEPEPVASGRKSASADSKPAEAQVDREAHAAAKIRGVDRAAASAATAALEAEAYGKSPVTAEPAQAAPRDEGAPPAPSAETPATIEPAKKDGLGDIERENSDDPLEGL